MRLALSRVIAVSAFGAAAGAAQASCICVKCALPLYENFITSSEHMSPTMEVGTCHVATKFTTSIQPFQRGDVILFLHPVQSNRHINRIIGMPGDRVQMRDGQIVLNGEALTYVKQPPLMRETRRYDTGYFARCIDHGSPDTPCEVHRYTETLPSGRSYDVLDLGDHAADNTQEFLVPDGHIFVMGDHRDNALDSRFAPETGGPGFVPIENVQGVLEGL